MGKAGYGVRACVSCLHPISGYPSYCSPDAKRWGSAAAKKHKGGTCQCVVLQEPTKAIHIKP